MLAQKKWLIILRLHRIQDINAAFESGYESLSGFAESFRNVTGFSLNQSYHRDLITITRMLTPLGPMLAGTTEQGIYLLEFIDRRMLETQLRRLISLLHAPCVPGTHTHFDVLHLQLKEYFTGTRMTFELRLFYQALPFNNLYGKDYGRFPMGQPVHTRNKPDFWEIPMPFELSQKQMVIIE